MMVMEQEAGGGLAGGSQSDSHAVGLPREMAVQVLVGPRASFILLLSPHLAPHQSLPIAATTMASAALLPASASMSSLAGNGAGAGVGTSSVDSDTMRQRYDLGLLQAYLDALLPIVISANSQTLHATLFASSSWHEVAESFANDSSVTVVYVEKVRREAVQEDDEQGTFAAGESVAATNINCSPPPSSVRRLL